MQVASLCYNQSKLVLKSVHINMSLEANLILQFYNRYNLIASVHYVVIMKFDIPT